MSVEASATSSVPMKEGRPVIEYTVTGRPGPVTPPSGLMATIAFATLSLTGGSAMEMSFCVPAPPGASVVSRKPEPSITTSSLPNISGATPENVFDMKFFFVNSLCKYPESFGEIVDTFRARGVDLCNPYIHPHEKLMHVETSFSNAELYALLYKHMQKKN